MKKTKLSVCLVVKNEEKYLHRCLESIKEAADEIIVVDTGSTDKTIEIAKLFTDKVFPIKWRDDFSKARNSALSKATGEWVLFLDGDEVLDSQTCANLRARIEQEDFEGYLIKVLNYYNTGYQVEIAPDVIFRLFRNKKEYRFTGKIHEQICDNIISANPQAKIGFAEDICVIHYGYLPEEIALKNKSERNTKLLLKAVKKNPNNLLDRFHLGVEYFRVNQLNNALQEFLFVLGKVDLQAVYVPKLLRYITTCHYLLGNHQQALSCIEDIWIKAFKDHGDLYYLKGLICKDSGRYSEAYTAFKTCLAVPAQPTFYANLYCQYKEKIYQHLGEIAEYFMDHEAALQYYVQALKENPQLSPPLVRIVSILRPRENPEYAMKALNTVFDLTEPGIKLDLGNYFFRERAYQLAVECIDQAGASVNLPGEARLVKGLSLMRLKYYDQALQELNSIPPGHNVFVAAQGNLFLYYLLHENNKQALACLNNIKASGVNLALAETLEYLLEYRTVSEGDLRNSREAILAEVIEILELLIELAEWEEFEDTLDCFEGLFVSRPYKLLGDLFYNHEVYNRALEQYSMLDPQEIDAETQYRLGKIYRRLKDFSKAAKHFAVAMEKGLNTPKVNWAMARLHQDIAISILEEGISLYPDNIEMLVMLNKLKHNLIEV